MPATGLYYGGVSACHLFTDVSKTWPEPGVTRNCSIYFEVLIRLLLWENTIRLTRKFPCNESCLYFLLMWLCEFFIYVCFRLSLTIVLFVKFAISWFDFNFHHGFAPSDFVLFSARIRIPSERGYFMKEWISYSFLPYLFSLTVVPVVYVMRWVVIVKFQWFSLVAPGRLLISPRIYVVALKDSLSNFIFLSVHHPNDFAQLYSPARFLHFK